jgi:branched-chain amino acid transport system substrate-binding protein
MKKLMIIFACLSFFLAVFVGSATAKTMKFGVNLPLTGPFSNFGMGMYNAFKLAIDQGVASGKLGDIKLEVIPGDNAGDTAQGVSLATKHGADPSVGGDFCCWVSGIGIATHSTYNRYNLPVILGGSNDHRSSRPFHNSKVVFRNSPYDLVNMRIAALFATDVAKFKRIYLIDDNTAFATTQCNEFTKFAGEFGHGQAIIGRESIVPGEKDFTPLLTKIKPMNIDLLYFGGRIVEAALIRKQMVKLGFKAPMQSSGGVFSDTYIKLAGDSAENTYASFWGLPLKAYPEGRGLKFEKDYAAAGFKDPFESFGPMAYAAGQVYVQAIERLVAKGKDVNRKNILKELETGTFKTLIGDFGFDKNGMPDILHIAIYEVVNGKWKMHYRTDRKATKLLKVTN